MTTTLTKTKSTKKKAATKARSARSVQKKQSPAKKKSEPKASRARRAGSSRKGPAAKKKPSSRKTPIPESGRRLTPAEVTTLWRYFKRTGDQKGQHRLIEQYQHLIRYSAERVKTRLPREIEIEDLESAGFFGLLDAIKGFDLSRGVKFETYCGPRIRGAILDELRSLDWVPRLVRARSSKVDAASVSLEATFGRPASPQEMATKLECTFREFVKLAREASTVGVFNITQNAQDEESGRGLREIEGLQDRKGQDPANRSQRTDLKILVTKGLSKKERLIIVLYYYEGMTMREIGDSLGLSESRVSQMHAAILIRLKKNLDDRRHEFDISSGLEY